MVKRKHLLVTNDFPPKIGGIQNYLWELWRRLPPGTASVYTTPYPGAEQFDQAQGFPVWRSPEPFLIPYPWLGSRLRRLANQTEAELIILDPALPLGAIGPRLGHPYAVVVHGAEMTIPGRLGGLSALMRSVLRSASLVLAAGQYPLAEAARCARTELPSLVIPPGVDTERFRPPSDQKRGQIRAGLGIGPDDVLLATVSRLVPRKGMDTLIKACAEVDRRLGAGEHDHRSAFRVIIGGTGRQESELAGLIESTGAPVSLAGRLSDEEVVDLYGAADLMAMVCNERWFGLEQEGFGIVFLEAAACGVAQVAGRSGGSHEAVVDGVTGLVVDNPTDVRSVANAIEALVLDPEKRSVMGKAARRRAEQEFNYDLLAGSLAAALDSVDLTVARPRR